MTDKEHETRGNRLVEAISATAEAFNKHSNLWDNPINAGHVAEAWREASQNWNSVRHDDKELLKYAKVISLYCSKFADGIDCESFQGSKDSWTSAKHLLEDISWVPGKEAAKAAERAAMFCAKTAELASKAISSAVSKNSWGASDHQDSVFVGLLNRTWSNNLSFHASVPFASSGFTSAAQKFEELLAILS